MTMVSSSSDSIAGNMKIEGEKDLCFNLLKKMMSALTLVNYHPPTKLMFLHLSVMSFYTCLRHGVHCEGRCGEWGGVVVVVKGMPP